MNLELNVWEETQIIQEPDEFQLNVRHFDIKRYFII